MNTFLTRTKVKLVITFILCCFLVGVLNLKPVFAEDTPPVKKLRDLYNTNEEFKTNMDIAFRNMQDPPPGFPYGQENPWKDKKFDDLCAFFNKWYSFVPNLTNGLSEFIEPFYMFYYKNKYGEKFVTEEPGFSWTVEFVKARAKFMDSKESLYTIQEWLKSPSSHMEQFIVPPGGFKSFNEFFIRDVKPGVRPINAPMDDSLLVAPADTIINIINSDLTADTQLPIKGRMQLNVQKLLDNSQFSGRFIGGTAISCVLMPNVYHHFHAPVSGLMLESKENVSGLYFGNPDFPKFFHNGNVGYDSPFSIFEFYHRGYFIIRTEKFGYVGMVPVGLDDISSINFEEKFKNLTLETQKPVYKGDKLGHFAYGGSLVILLFEKGVINSIGLPQGQPIGNLNPISECNQVK